MIPRLVARVLPRPFALNVAVTAGLRSAFSARQHLVARTFLTTAHVSKPAAKDGATTSKSTKAKSSKAKATPKKKKAAAKKATATKKKKPAKKSKTVDSDDPDARFKAGLKAVKVKSSEMPPMKPVSPYSFFIREQYNGVAPTGGFRDKSVELAARWKQMSDEEKQRYVQQAEDQKEVFLKAQEEWYKNADPRILRAINIKRKAENKAKIHPPSRLRAKRPLTSYMLFMMDVRDTVALDPSLPPRDALLKRSGQIGKMWQELPAEEKQRYMDRYRKEFEEYKTAQSANP